MGKVQQVITGLNNQLKLCSYLDKYAYIPEVKLFQMAPQLHPLFIFILSESTCLFIVDINVRKEPIWKFLKVNPF